MTLFEIFGREKRELSKSEIARLLGLPESSTSDLLTTLHQLGYLTRTVITRRFYPTNRLLKVARDISAHHTVTVFGQEATNILAEKTGESSFCGILMDDRVELMTVTDGTSRLRYVARPGDQFPLHSTAIGKAILGQLPPEEAGRLLRLHPLVAVTDKTLTDPESVEAELAKSGESGVYRTIGEGSTSATSAVAVAGRVGDQVVGLCVIGPTERLMAQIDKLTTVLAQVRDTVFG
jgi:DNA-binding IclR family transcriptional regulator